MRIRNVRLGAAIAVVLACLLAGGAGLAQTAAPLPRATAAAIDRVFAGYDRTDSPGCALALFKDGRIAYERGYGMADLT
jgi:CubicO group peptidase (beta-lactamase class C family)